MKVSNIKIKNFRLLKDFTLDLEDELSLVIGKNNVGKTSILSVMDKFLNHPDRNAFCFDDFSISYRETLRTLIESAPLTEEEYNRDHDRGIKLLLFIEYGPDDSLAHIEKVMMDLNPENNVVVLGFCYLLNFTDYLQLKRDYQEFRIKQEQLASSGTGQATKDLHDFLSENHETYFKVSKRTIRYDNATKTVDETKFIDLVRAKVDLRNIINFKYISAKREVANTQSDKTLSSQTSKIYQRTEMTATHDAVVETFKQTLSDADANLSRVYKRLFGSIIEKVRDFGGITVSESEIEIVSSLRHQELLEGNTTVVYKHDSNNRLPEHFNGLGYMNLLSMIFELEILRQEFKRDKISKPADINLLFIEEPEAHTHPQMQYIFIKNIKKLIKEGIQREDGETRSIQYIISTHSAHIVADCDFDDIKYLLRDGCGVYARNLKHLRQDYSTSNQYQFLKQYLTISRAEIFFADKAILIEGDTERLLFPAMMRKIDMEMTAFHAGAGITDPWLPLLSQNISIVEVGAYAHIFERFLAFIGIKALIITDLDSVNDTGGACEVANGVSYSNAALKHFFGDGTTLADLKGYALDSKRFKLVEGRWIRQPEGNLCIVYQTLENGYHARSFEDCFFHLNRTFVTERKAEFRGLKLKSHFDDAAKNAYQLAQECVIKKTHVALDILFCSNERLDNWQIPAYIKEGLVWLKQG